MHWWNQFCMPDSRMKQKHLENIHLSKCHIKNDYSWSRFSFHNSSVDYFWRSCELFLTVWIWDIFNKLTSSNVECNKLFFAKKSCKRNTTFLKVYQKFWIAEYHGYFGKIQNIKWKLYWNLCILKWNTNTEKQNKKQKKYHSLLDYLPSKWGAKFQSTNMLIDKCQISLWLKIDVSIVRLEPGDNIMNFITRRIVKSCYMIRCIMYALWLVLDVATNNIFLF